MNWAGGAPLLETPTASGNDPFALARLIQVRLLFCKGQAWGRYYEIAEPDSPLLDLLNVRYVLSRAAIPHPGKLARIAELPGQQIYENPGALPRFFLVGQVRRVADMDAALRVLRSPQFAPRAEAVVEGPVPFDAPGTARDLPHSEIKVVEYKPRQFVLEVDTAAPAFLVTSEAFYPGWRAHVDGREQAPVLTNVAFRGLPLAAGHHEVKMRFDPPILWRSAWITFSGLALMLLALWFGDNNG